MSLTKSDLQAIRSIVQEEVKKEVEQQLKPVHKKLNEHSKILKEHSKELAYLRKTANVTISYFEKEDKKLEKRVARIESRLGFPVAS